MTITEDQIVERLCAKDLLTKGESAQIIETLFELLKQSLEWGDDLLISGFGKFSVKEKYQRKGRNPQSGEPVMLLPHTAGKFEILFKPSFEATFPDIGFWDMGLTLGI